MASTYFQDWVSGPVTAAMFRTVLGQTIDGVLAEYVALKEHGVVRIPEHLSFEEAATLPCAGLTAWQALVTEGRIKAGDTVVVMGTGGVSIFALQFALLCGARVIATTGSDSKMDRLQSLGASAVINYKTTPEWDKQVLELTGGAGADHVVEVGGAGTLPRSLRAVRHGGFISLIGVLGGIGEKFSPGNIIPKGVRLAGNLCGFERDVRGYESGDRAQRIAPGGRSDLPIRRGRSGAGVSGKRPAFRQGLHPSVVGPRLRANAEFVRATGCCLASFLRSSSPNEN